MKFKKERICHPFNMKESQKCIGLKGHFSNNLFQLENLIVKRNNIELSTLKRVEEDVLDTPFVSFEEFDDTTWVISYWKYFYPIEKSFYEEETKDLLFKVAVRKEDKAKFIITGQGDNFILVEGYDYPLDYFYQTFKVEE